MSTSGDIMSISGGVQYIEECSVHRGNIMSTLGDTMSTSGDTIRKLGDIMSTSGNVQYIRGIS